MLGDGAKIVRDFERPVRFKMGKSLYAARALKAGHVLSEEDILIKTPAEGLAPYEIVRLIGRRLTQDLPEEALFSDECLDG